MNEYWSVTNSTFLPEETYSGESLIALQKALCQNREGVCRNWSPGYGYLDENGDYRDDHTHVEHVEGLRVIAALRTLGFEVTRS